VLGNEAEGVADDIEPTTEQQRGIDRGPQPLVRIDDDRGGPVPAEEWSTKIRVDRDGTCVRGVDVQPDVLAGGNVSQGGDRVDGRVRPRVDGRDQADLPDV